MDTDNKYGMLEQQKYYIPMIREFHNYCIKHNIEYSLSYGTLLGAVRHKGFIPWDDDVDIMFDRRNYELFLKCFLAEPMDGYVIVGKLWIKKISRIDNPQIEKEGQCIDLFVLDPVPRNTGEEKAKVLLLKALQGMMKEKPEYEAYSVFYQILSFITFVVGRIFSKDKKVNWYDRLSQWSGRKQGDYINIYNGLFSQIGSKKYKKDITDNYVSIEFEGLNLMSIRNYDSYLTDLYGDYMKLPPEAERRPKHL